MSTSPPSRDGQNGDEKDPHEKLEEVREELERVAERDVPISEDFERILKKLDQEEPP